ncbi:MAG TPA: ABC transporter substrate-binding protein [Alphaproteobacteria bacterium]|nr:ABC transporter substrate-binding protein [Alphaproteobacteria bacterium]
MSQRVTFKVGEASPANTFFAIWMAQAAGFYETNGLNLEIVHVVGGKESGPDLTSGRIDLMHIGMSSVVRANAAGSDLVTVGSLSNIIRNSMFTAPGIKAAADLKGKAVGISSAGSETDPTTTLALRKLGLKRDDVTIKEIGVKRLDAVRNGEVAASLMGEPYRSQALALGMKPIVDLYADKTPWLYSGLVVHRKFLKDHRDRVKSFLKATVEGNYLAVSNAEKAKPVLAKELGITDPTILDTTYSNFRAETPLNAELTREGAKNIVEVLAPANKNLDAYMGESVYNELKAEGFYATMEKKYGGR